MGLSLFLMCKIRSKLSNKVSFANNVNESKLYVDNKNTFLVHNAEFIKTHFQHYKIMETMKRKVTKPL